LSIDSRINTLWSLSILSVTSARSALMASTSCRILAATATVLAPLCFWMSTRMIGVPFTSARLLMSS
jgi:hypothetical protein